MGSTAPVGVIYELGYHTLDSRHAHPVLFLTILLLVNCTIWYLVDQCEMQDEHHTN